MEASSGTAHSVNFGDLPQIHFPVLPDSFPCLGHQNTCLFLGLKPLFFYGDIVSVSGMTGCLLNTAKAIPLDLGTFEVI